MTPDLREIQRLQLELDAARATIAKLRQVAAAFVRTVSSARRAIEQRGRGGQHVSYHGDFAAASPSVITNLVWWAREIELALNAAEKP